MGLQKMTAVYVKLRAYNTKEPTKNALRISNSQIKPIGVAAGVQCDTTVATSMSV
jgi:hypothetical protein